ncbi:MAG: carbonic anhydrase family protein [Gammaproteobacteria bacterium]
MRFLKTSLTTMTILPLAFSAALSLATEVTGDQQRLELLGILPAPATETPAEKSTEAATTKPTQEAPPHHEDAAPKEAAPTMAEDKMETMKEAMHAKPAADHHAPQAAEAPPHAKAAKTHHGAVHWSYEGPGAPHYWGDLKAEFATCKSGRSQSPIDISATVVTELPTIQVNYSDTALNIVNNGHAIQANYQSGSFINVGGKRFNLLQFHFHSPSEHTIGGKAYPMVAHLVHQADDGQLGVIGVMIKEGQPNPLMEQLWAHLPETAGTSVTLEGESINVSDLLPRDHSYFNYSGSLTTPPCTEGVQWMVLAAPVEASAEQIARFRALYPNDARPVQAVNGRTIRLSN